MDVGGPSEQPDEGNRRKAAFSDALKRAAVKFGIGRYLYRLPSQWVDYDPQKRQFVRTPKLPPSALPRRPLPVPADSPARPKSTGGRTQAGPRQRHGVAPSACKNTRTRWSKQKLCRPGDLMNFVVQAGVQAGHTQDLTAWEGPAIRLAVEQTRVFKEGLRSQTEAQKGAA